MLVAWQRGVQSDRGRPGAVVLHHSVVGLVAGVEGSIELLAAQQRVRVHCTCAAGHTRGLGFQGFAARSTWEVGVVGSNPRFGTPMVGNAPRRTPACRRVALRHGIRANTRRPDARGCCHRHKTAIETRSFDTFRSGVYPQEPGSSRLPLQHALLWRTMDPLPPHSLTSPELGPPPPLWSASPRRVFSYCSDRTLVDNKSEYQSFVNSVTFENLMNPSSSVAEKDLVIYNSYSRRALEGAFSVVMCSRSGTQKFVCQK